MNTDTEKGIIFDHFTDGLIAEFEAAGCHLAGGAILSVFTGQQINDFDIYCPYAECAPRLIKRIEDSYATPLYQTGRANLMLHNCNGKRANIQIIKEFFGTPEEIFSCFDFTCCMGAFSFASEKFTFHEDFMKAASQRRLMINPGTRYPIATLARVKKYAERGYTISNSELLRLALMINRLKIDSYEAMIRQISGVSTNYYRRAVKKLEEMARAGKPFDALEAIGCVIE